MARAATELRQMEYAELDIKLSETRKELFNLRFQLATGQLDNTARLGQLRKEVARIATLMREKEIEAAEGEPPPSPAGPPATPTTATTATTDTTETTESTDDESSETP